MKSLTSKVLLILVTVFVVYIIINYGIQHFIIYPSFLALERDEARKDVERAVQALSREIHHLDQLCADWAAWDDTYEFVQAPSEHEEYREANLIIGTFTASELNLIYFLDIEGTVVWGNIYDLETEETIRIADFPNDAFPKTHPLLSYKIVEESPADRTVNGVFMTEQGPMLVSARPILNSEYEGPIRGTVLLGRLLNESFVSILAEQTRVDLQVFPVQTGSLPEPLQAIPNQITTESPYLFEEKSDTHLQVYTTFADIKGDAALLLNARVARKIAEGGMATTRFVLISLLIAGLLILLVILLLLRRVILKPIAQLTTHALSVGETGDLSVSLSMQRSDEIGILSRELDSMLKQLDEARRKLADQSYRSGMAEMASGVLHNVRNALSPVFGHLDLVCSSLRKIPFSQITMAHQELNEATTSTERREELINFALLTNTSLTNLVQETQGKLDETMERIMQIEAIMDNHEQWAYSERPDEQLKVEELVHDASKFLQKDFQDALTVHFDPDLSAVGTVRGHRLSCLQVLENLLINAAEAIQRQRPDQGAIHLRAALEPKDGQEIVHLQICDNGDGIDAENLERIFERGFTTKPKKSSGLGLHWCANILMAMGGQISAESEGRGKGTCMHVLVPSEESQ
jgi:sensor domain CHASE-containing protein